MGYAWIGRRNDQPDISALEACNLPLNHASFHSSAPRCLVSQFGATLIIRR